MKKLFFLVGAIAAMVVLFASCGNNGTKPSTSEDSTVMVDSLTVQADTLVVKVDSMIVE